MNKSDLIQRLADQHELSKAEAGRILETLLDTVVGAVKKGEAVTIPGSVRSSCTPAPPATA